MWRIMAGMLTAESPPYRISDKIEAAYRRSDFFDKRARLMAQWADYVTGQAKKSVDKHAA